VALNGYLRMKGQKSGDVKGGVTQKGREGTIAVVAVSHEILSPRDPASGLPAGRRMHKPIVITKELDQSTPVLYGMLVSNENITDWVLQYFSPNRAGAEIGSEAQNFTIRLTNASITDIRLTKPLTWSPDLAKLPDYQEISFAYQKIEWTWVQGGITATDDWSGASS
jgi:type VI secretion system secreted protein Hcp